MTADTLKRGDIVEVHFIKALGPDLWISAEVLNVYANKFEVKTLRGEFPGGYTHIAIPLGTKENRWRKP